MVLNTRPELGGSTRGLKTLLEQHEVAAFTWSMPTGIICSSSSGDMLKSAARCYMSSGGACRTLFCTGDVLADQTARGSTH